VLNHLADALYVNMVAAGESGGALDVILERLATYLEKNSEIIRKIKGCNGFLKTLLMPASL